ncbi:MAG: glutamate racemase, partial [Methylocystis sp.]|nr:glutamate racemase [Methylocystis sp.]
VQADGARTDAVVLACTHYPLLTEEFRRLAPWPVEWIDPAPAIARRADYLLSARFSPEVQAPAQARRRALFTSGAHPEGKLRETLTRYGFE